MKKLNSVLRKKAEELAKKTHLDVSSLSVVDIKEIIHELEVHQIELEMQNDELKQIQKELEEERANFESLYNDAPLGYVTINENQKVIQVNDTMANMLLCDKTDILNQSFTNFIHWDDKDIFYLFLVQLRASGIKHSCQLRLIISDKTYFYAILEVKVRKNNEVRISVTNINNLVEMQKKAEESDRLKSAFLANMSHEIRTPMNGIMGFAELLKTPGLAGETQHEYINIIEQSGLRMLNIINNIVDISKIESGLMEVHNKETNINEQLDYTYTFFKPEVERKNLKFILKNKLVGKEAIITTDSEKVYAILTNLIKNAIKFTNTGNIEFGCERKGNFLRFCVKDTGIGINKDKHQAIFERFIQEDIKDKDVNEGAGLGLSICNAYVKMLGGDIRVESEKGKGSTFHFYILDRVDTTVSYKTEEPNKKPGLSQKTNKSKILIVEDDETSLRLLVAMLNSHKPEILTTDNGIDAVEICRKNPDIDLIFMDIRIPKQNGFEAVQQIRKFNKSVIIIAQTADGFSADKKKSIEIGCDAYLSKPIINQELFSLLNQYLVTSV